MSGRTVWLAKDADWHNRNEVVILGEEFGPVGPLVIDWLECAAKRQNDGGHVKAGVRALARWVYSDVVTVGHVVSRAVTLGLLAEYEEDSGLFKARISWWEADQDRALAATRKARQRGGTPENTEDSASLSRSVTVGHAESQNVPLQDRTGQERTEEKTTSAAPTQTAPDPAVVALSQRLAAGVHANDPKFDRAKAMSPRWLTDMRLLLADRNGDQSEVERVIDFVISDPFERSNVLSPAKMRQRFTALLLKAGDGSGRGLRALPSPSTSRFARFDQALEGAGGAA